jgi:hypothetical protein
LVGSPLSLEDGRSFGIPRDTRVAPHPHFFILHTI